MFEATVFALTEVRGRNLATNTIGAVLRSIKAFQLFLDTRGINLDVRLNNCSVLSLGEIEDLARVLRLPLAKLATLSKVDMERDSNRKSELTLMSHEKARIRVRPNPSTEVDAAVAATRLRYVRAYIVWLANERRTRHNFDTAAAVRLGSTVELVSKAIESRIPNGSRLKTLTQREGLSEDQVAQLIRITEPDSPDNPWRDQHTRYRNALMIRWFLFLGLRVGEALGVRVSDIVVYRKEVTIHRRADDPDDPRHNQPQTKTRARILPLSTTLVAETQAYILNHRSKLTGARRHPFLFVASRTGQPMSLVAVAKLFNELREHTQLLPHNLSAHLLRHTWNDAFSAKMDSASVTPEDERQARSYLMGWAPTSETAALYTRRHIRHKANEVSLALQRQLLEKGHK
ncbi:MAG: tyrosine-type recombinase/integrase [Telluria sp.]